LTFKLRTGCLEVDFGKIAFIIFPSNNFLVKYVLLNYFKDPVSLVLFLPLLISRTQNNILMRMTIMKTTVLFYFNSMLFIKVNNLIPCLNTLIIVDISRKTIVFRKLAFTLLFITL
jgi:hypothetical protein